MNQDLKILFSTTYLGPIDYFSQIIPNKISYFDNEEHYFKQTYRNRCIIYSANGRLSLSIPVNKVYGNHTKVKDIQIVYQEDWQKMHWRSIVSAYNHSPFFLYYQDDFAPFYAKKFKYLIDFNHQITTTVLKLININTKIVYTEKYIKQEDISFVDYRNRFNPKKGNPKINFPHYTQVFEAISGFIPNLSIIDLLFNEGPNTKDYLIQVKNIFKPS